MHLKRLTIFMTFNWEEFSKGKEFTVTGISDWTVYETKKHGGTLIEVCITKDETDYQIKNGEVVSNLMEKLKIKVTKDVKASIGDKIQLINASGSVYGRKQADGSWSNYKDQLSVKCDDIIII